MTAGETLGTALRAGRLRYGWAPSLAAYVRIADMDGGRLRFEVVPRDALAGKAPKLNGREYRMWYAADQPPAERAETRRLVEGVCLAVLAPAGATRCTVRRPVAFVADDDGAFVAWAEP